MDGLNKDTTVKQVELNGVLAEFREALEEEIDRIKQSGQSSTLLYAGRPVASSGSDCWYHFNVEYAPSLPADTPCKLYIGKDRFDVTVISFEENAIIVSSKNPLPDTIGKARLENGATILMERLIACIEENADKENTAGNRMFSQEGTVYKAKSLFSYEDLSLAPSYTDDQKRAIRSALTRDITYIWGPPGTGKTTVIGEIVDGLYRHGRSVLIVSHTNTAVDGAIEKADKSVFGTNLNKETAYPILRIGIPSRPLPDRVLINAHVAELGKELYEQKDVLEKRQSEIRHRMNYIRPLLAKNVWIKENKLPVICEIIQYIYSLEEDAHQLQDKIEDLGISVERKAAENPEYSQYERLEKEYRAKKDEYTHLRNQALTLDTTIRRTAEQIQAALDEQKKHDKYVELRAQEAQYMSQQFLRRELATIIGRISQLESEIYTLEKEQEAAQHSIAEYEQKGPVAKLFGGKAAAAQAQIRLAEIAQRLHEIKDERQRHLKRKQEYKQQLDDLLLLLERMKAVFPSQTKEYWEEQSAKLETKLEETKCKLPEIVAQRDALAVKLEDIEVHRNQAKLALDVRNELLKKIQQLEGKLKQINDEISREEENCRKQLEDEYLQCGEFVVLPEEKTNQEALEELSRLLADIESEIANIDVPALEEEDASLREELINISLQLNNLKQQMKELEKQAIANARIVGTTLAKSYLSDALRSRSFDTVVLDEASMASIPALWCAGYLAEKNLVIVGDFLQLPPIVMADTPMAKKWLGKDIFYHSGMQNQARKPADCPDNFVMLKDQFRMESDIADLSNVYYGDYGGLQSHDEDKRMSEQREKFYGWYSGKRTKHHVHLIDTENLHAWVTGVPQGKSHSRLNCFSAAVDVDLAFKFLEKRLGALDPLSAEPAKEAPVLIVAPYRPHVSRIQQLIELEYKNRGFKENLNYIRTGTIHSFQGSEADIVIFDLVIDEPHWKANLFMTNQDISDDLRKMFNVAISRARFKLYIVGNFSYCQKHAKNNALAELLDKLIVDEQLVKVNVKNLLPDIAFSRKAAICSTDKPAGKHIVCREETFFEYFMADIRAFRKRLIIYSPFITENRLSTLLPDFADAVSTGKQIIVVTKALSDRGKTELEPYRKCERALRDMGVSVIHKKGMHEKLIFIDSEAVWIGSLNALSFTGLTGEVMQRHADEALAAEYEKLFDIAHICDVADKTDKQKCPICGQEIILRESDSGGIYWECVNKDYSRSAEQQYPLDGILRCKCGAPYVFSMKNQPRWVCSSNPSHYQLMRESDLKLEKMAALITSKTARKEVDRFFAQKRKERSATKGVPKKAGLKTQKKAY